MKESLEKATVGGTKSGIIPLFYSVVIDCSCLLWQVCNSIGIYGLTDYN